MAIKVKDFYELSTPNFLKRFEGNREFISGVEYEIESIQGFGGLTDYSTIEIVDDHSLRNNGKEFKTIPMTFEEQLDCFDLIHKSLKLGKDPYSDRTSIHVHVNVRELSVEEVCQLVLAYALFEPLFFDFVGDVRKNSIFCVPLNYTYLPSLYKLPMDLLASKWHKYTAFNICPVNSFGTVEFRHLYGTGDREVFIQWLTALKQLYTTVVTTPDLSLIKLIEEGVSVKQLADMFIPIFSRNYSPAQLQTALADTLLDVKLSVGGLK